MEEVEHMEDLIRWSRPWLANYLFNVACAILHVNMAILVFPSTYNEPSGVTEVKITKIRPDGFTLIRDWSEGYHVPILEVQKGRRLFYYSRTLPTPIQKGVCYEDLSPNKVL